MAIIKVDIISDVVCAWCYIGKRNLDKAIALYQKTYPGGKNDTFQITWRPYYLNYNMYSESVPKSEIAKIKLASMSDEKIAAITKRVNQAGQAVGINFKSGGKVGRTRDAHRLIHLCQIRAPESLDTVVEKIFEAYHELEMDIAAPEVLRKIAIDSGIAQAEADPFLDSSTDEFGDLVDTEAQKNRDLVNAGVPLFIIQDEYRLDGAQDPFDFMELFVKAREQAGKVSP